MKTKKTKENKIIMISMKKNPSRSFKQKYNKGQKNENAKKTNKNFYIILRFGKMT